MSAGRSVAIVGACAIAWAAPALAQASTTEVTGFDSATTARIDRAVSDAFIASGSPGYAVGVWAPGKGTYLRAYGVSNRRTGAPLQIEDHFRAGSITKTMTAVAVLRLAEQGRLSLDDHLEKYVTGIPNGRIITIRQLLGMRAGIFDFAEAPWFVRITTRNPTMPWTVSDSIRVLRRTTPAYPPGKGAAYCNENYVLLGRVIERATGRPAEEVIRDEVIRPAGLTETTLPTRTGMPGPFRRGYIVASGGRLRDTTLQNPYIAWTAGNGISTLRDLGTWAPILATGTLLTPGMFAQQQQRVRLAGTPPGTSYGLGLGFSRNEWRGHSAYIRGYSTAMYHQVSTGYTVVATGNEGADAAVGGVVGILASLP